MTEINTNCIKLKDITEMKEDELFNLISGIRERREKPIREYKDALNRANEIKSEKLKEKLLKKAELLNKKLIQIAKLEQDAIVYIEAIRMIRIEAGQYDIELT